MDFPFGHHNRNRREEEEEDQYPPPSQPYQRQHISPQQDQYSSPPPPLQPYQQHHQQNNPPPYYRNDEEQYPIQSQQHQRPTGYSPYNRTEQVVEEENIYGRPRPPSNPQSDYGYPQPTGGGYDPPVQHVSHEFSNQGGFQPNPSEFRQETQTHQSHHHVPSFIHHQTHDGSGTSSGAGILNNKPTVRVYSKAETGYSLTIRDGHVILARSDVNDVYQHWIKDERYSIRVKDEEGFPSFALVNKATGQAMKHSTEATRPVQLVPYNPEVLDQSVLWTESRDLGDGYRTIRMVSNIRLNVDAFNGDQNHGGVRDGTTIVLWEWKKGDNQRWKIVPYCDQNLKIQELMKSDI